MMKDFTECGSIISNRAQDRFVQEEISYGKLFFPRKVFLEGIDLYVENERRFQPLIFCFDWTLSLMSGLSFDFAQHSFCVSVCSAK